MYFPSTARAFGQAVKYAVSGMDYMGKPKVLQPGQLDKLTLGNSYGFLVSTKHGGKSYVVMVYPVES
jgi:hypothetical protein